MAVTAFVLAALASQVAFATSGFCMFSGFSPGIQSASLKLEQPALISDVTFLGAPQDPGVDDEPFREALIVLDSTSSEIVAYAVRGPSGVYLGISANVYGNDVGQTGTYVESDVYGWNRSSGQLLPAGDYSVFAFGVGTGTFGVVLAVTGDQDCEDISSPQATLNHVGLQQFSTDSQSANVMVAPLAGAATQATASMAAEGVLVGFARTAATLGDLRLQLTDGGSFIDLEGNDFAPFVFPPGDIHASLSYRSALPEVEWVGWALSPR